MQVQRDLHKRATRGKFRLLPMISPSLSPHWDLYPKVYVAPKISFPLIDNLNGDISKDVWKAANFSDTFDDIRGPIDAPEGDRPNDNCRTRFKAVWDDSYLYIGAILESDFETEAHFTDRNSPIFQRDSDFEIFVDPFGTCHNYKELELNAINTVWNLMLNKPYDDGGEEYSGRIAHPGDDRYYEVYHQKTATKILKGTLNEKTASATWSVEVALSFDDLLAQTRSERREPFPTEGDMMRINFSRVERQGKLNWTWQPQIVWDPPKQKYTGFVAMHLPDAWGYLVFGGADGEGAMPRDPSWPVRIAAMNVYYSQVSFSKQNNGKFAALVSELDGLVDRKITSSFNISISLVSGGYIATVTENPDRTYATITNDRFLQVYNAQESSVS